MRAYLTSMLALAACGKPEPSVVDPRFDALWEASAVGIDGDLDADGDLVTVVGRFPPITTGDAGAEVAAFVTTWDDLLAGSATLLGTPEVYAGVGTTSFARFGVVSNGLPVFDAYVLGEVSPPDGVTFLVLDVPRDLDVPATPSVSSDDALAAAEDVEGLEIVTPTGDPVLGIFNAGLYLDEDTASTLAWQVSLVDGTVWVDALTGDVVSVDPAVTDALDLALYSAGHSDNRKALLGLGGQPATRVPWMTEEGPVPGADPSAAAERVSGYIRTVHDYYEGTHFHTGVDGFGSVQTAVYVHFGDPTYRNAHFSLDALWIGDAASALDVIGHEFTHGVIRHTAALRYQAWSGALNESIADAFGAFVDTDGKWEIAEDIEGGPLRDLERPGRKKQPDHWDKRKTAASSVCKATAPQCPEKQQCIAGRCYKDHGYVHVNSGIPNHATWLMAAGPVDTIRRKGDAKVRSIGEEAVSKTMLQVLWHFLQPNSKFGPYARSMVQACKDEVKANGATGTYVEMRDCGAMVNAFYAVGIHPGPDKDEDTVVDGVDICPDDFDPEQEDADNDRLGDACDDLDGTRIKIVTRHSNSMDRNPIHLVFNGEAMDESTNKLTPGSTHVRRIDASGVLTVGVGRQGTVWQTTWCGPAVAGGEYEAVYWEGIGLVTFTLSCWRTGPGVPPPDPTDPSAEPP